MTAVSGVDKVGYQQAQGEGPGAHVIIRAWLQKASVGPAEAYSMAVSLGNAVCIYQLPSENNEALPRRP